MICKHNFVKLISFSKRRILRHISIEANKYKRENDVFAYFTNNLKIPKEKITNILLKTPSIQNTSKEQLFSVLEMFDNHKIDHSELLTYPKLLNFPTTRIDYRIRILTECGFQKVSALEISTYMKLMTSKTITDLKDAGYLAKDEKVQDRIVKHLTMWPTSPPMINTEDDSKLTLNYIRMKVLERYLELILDLQPETFRRGLNTYVKLRHRPLSHINLTLQYLQDVVKMPNKKINSNLFVLLANPRNLHMMLTDVKSLADIDIRDILIKRPTLVNVSYKTFSKIQNLLNDYNIPIESQQKCLEIYSLSFETIQQRFKDIKTIPEFNALINHPRILRLIYYKTKADSRLQNSKLTNQCVSLNMLSASSKNYDSIFSNIDERSSCRDYIQNIITQLDRKYTYNEIKDKIQRHAYFTKTATTNVKFTLDQLRTKNFTAEDLFLNCQICLYPWEKIEKYLNILLRPYNLSENRLKLCILNNINEEQIAFERLTKSQILSLTLYYLEKRHNFNDQGIWIQQSPSDKDHKEILQIIEAKL
ncbi:transcription termination factor 5, mitochondrial-like [Arctopsyche grandis]|uniref:transcription termination factor 5, mitochondrial-like n=1 Tax=Arctopsyche grandis TaxID=121162 RepID=UPI00406D860F